MLKIETLNLQTDDFALRNISFELLEGQVHIILGQTGCGKTLLMETIIGLRQPHSGNIIIDGKKANTIPVEKRAIAYVPQDLALFPHLSVKENILYAYTIDKTKKLDQGLFNRLVKTTGIEQLLNRPINHLSGGEKQRIALVRAIIAQNKILMLDEPFSAINDTAREELRLMLKKIQSEFQITTVIVTHDLKEAFFFGDTISIMKDGRIIQTAPKKEAFFHPKNIEVAEFLGIKNIFHATIKEEKEDTLLVYCEQLKTKVHLPLNKKTSLEVGNKIEFGIRKSDLSILPFSPKPKPVSNQLFAEIVIIIEKIATVDIVVKELDTGYVIFVETPMQNFKKLGLVNGQKVMIYLRFDDIIVFGA